MWGLPLSVLARPTPTYCGINPLILQLLPRDALSFTGFLTPIYVVARRFNLSSRSSRTLCINHKSLGPLFPAEPPPLSPHDSCFGALQPIKKAFPASLPGLIPLYVSGEWVPLGSPRPIPTPTLFFCHSIHSLVSGLERIGSRILYGSLSTNHCF